MHHLNHRLLDRHRRLCRGAQLLGILGLILAEIFTRNFLASSLHFSWDLAGYLMGACFLLGCGSAMKAGSHVRVTALIEISSPIVGRDRVSN